MRLRLSQRELGLLMGLSPKVAAPRINQYERGSAAPTVEDLDRLAGALGLPTAALVAEDPALVRLLRAWADAPPQARTAAVRELEANARAAGHPGRKATRARIRDARAAWKEEAVAAAQARQLARVGGASKAPTPSSTPKPGRTAAPRKKARTR